MSESSSQLQSVFRPACFCTSQSRREQFLRLCNREILKLCRRRKRQRNRRKTRRRPPPRSWPGSSFRFSRKPFALPSNMRQGHYEATTHTNNRTNKNESNGSNSSSSNKCNKNSKKNNNSTNNNLNNTRTQAIVPKWTQSQRSRQQLQPSQSQRTEVSAACRVVGIQV